MIRSEGGEATFIQDDITASARAGSTGGYSAGVMGQGHPDGPPGAQAGRAGISVMPFFRKTGISAPQLADIGAYAFPEYVR